MKERKLVITDHGEGTEIELESKNLSDEQVIFVSSVVAVGYAKQLGVPKEGLLEAIGGLFDTAEDVEDE